MTNHFIVIGGGIAGVSCAETLALLCTSEEDRVTLITASPLIKAVINFKQITKALEEFDVEEKSSTIFQSQHKNVSIIHKTVTDLNIHEKTVQTNDGECINYTKLCVCSGGSPNIIAKDNPLVIGIRDTESVKTFQKKLAGARRVLIVGNGGIATELAYEIEGCDVVWAIKDESISSTFVDPGAAEFFLPELKGEKVIKEGPLKRLKYTVADDEDTTEQSTSQGGALGPDWTTGFKMQGQAGRSRDVHVEYQCEIKEVLTPDEFRSRSLTPNTTTNHKTSEDWPIYVHLTNDKVYGFDFIVSATGVMPNTTIFTKTNNFDVADDGGIRVDAHMRTNFKDVYAAGDVCTASWEFSDHWFQMRLWSQARQMGIYSAQCMISDLYNSLISQDFCFELFAHVTKFFGYKVILLGKYNGQGLGQDYEVLLRMTKGEEYIKVVLHDGKMVGAVLIGETDLEETFENLILNRLDLTRYGADLLDPNIDIEDYFD